ncbi:MAG: hypothetical protein EUB_03475 [Eubacterium sp.]
MAVFIGSINTIGAAPLVGQVCDNISLMVQYHLVSVLIGNILVGFVNIFIGCQLEGSSPYLKRRIINIDFIQNDLSLWCFVRDINGKYTYLIHRVILKAAPASLLYCNVQRIGWPKIFKIIDRRFEFLYLVMACCQGLRRFKETRITICFCLEYFGPLAADFLSDIFLFICIINLKLCILQYNITVFCVLFNNFHPAFKSRIGLDGPLFWVI